MPFCAAHYDEEDIWNSLSGSIIKETFKSNHMRTLPILLFSTLIFGACNRDKLTLKENEVAVDMVHMAPQQVGAGAADHSLSNEKITADTSKKIIKTGDMHFETANVK